MLIWIGNHVKLRRGRLMVIYVLGYFIGRFWIEGLRIDNANAGGGLRLNQWVALAAIAGSAGFLVIDWLRHRDDPEPVAATWSSGRVGRPVERRRGGRRPTRSIDDVESPTSVADVDVEADDPVEPADRSIDDTEPSSSRPSRSRPPRTSTFRRMSDDLVLFERKDPGIAILTLNRPDRMNAWTGELSARYFDRLDECEADDSVKVIVITGAGRGYCAGADMDNLAAAGKQPGARGRAATARWPRPSHRDVWETTKVSKPTIVAINGACAGIGLVQALMCDLRFAASGRQVHDRVRPPRPGGRVRHLLGAAPPGRHGQRPRPA